MIKTGPVTVLALAMMLTISFGAASASIFNPLTDVSSANLNFWFDADDAATLSASGGSSGYVDQWNNKADGGTNNAVGVGTQRPQLVPNAMNGKPVVRFGAGVDGSAYNDILMTQSPSGFSGGAFGTTVITVVRLNVAPLVFSSVVSQSPDVVGGGMSYIIAGRTGGAAGTDHWAPAGAYVNPPVPVGNQKVVSWVVPQWADHPNGTRIFYDGVEHATEPYAGGAASLVPGPLRIGNWHEGRTDMVFPGDIAEVLVYDNALSDTDRQNVEAHLQEKWVPPPPPVVLPGEVPVTDIDVFDAATQLVDLNRQGNLQPYLAIDDDLGTFGSPTPSGNLDPAIVALELNGPFPVDRLRLAKTNLQGCNCSDLDGDGGNDLADLVVLWTDDTGPLNERTYLPVTGMTNGFEGTELLQTDPTVAGNGVYSDGTIVADNHIGVDSPVGHGRWWSVTFDAVNATAIGLRIARNPLDPDGSQNVHYGVDEYEVHSSVPEPASFVLLGIGLLGLLARRRCRRPSADR